MSVNSIFRQGVELKIFRSKLTECPQALGTVMALASDMALTRGLKHTPWSDDSEVIVTSDGCEIVGFLVFNSRTDIQIEFAWVEPGLRGEGVFDDMFSLLVTLFFMAAATLRVKDDFMTSYMAAALTRNGFVGSVYLPFKSDWRNGSILKNQSSLLFTSMV